MTLVCLAKSVSEHHDSLGLMTDLGSLAQAATAFVSDRAQQLCTFEYSVQSCPAEYHYLVFAGLESLLQRLLQFRFTTEQLEYLRYHPAFAAVPLAWFDHLSTMRFAGDLWSVQEGTAFGPGIPLVRITAPFDVACLIERHVLNSLNHETRVASYVSRLMNAASGRMLIESSTDLALDRMSVLATTRAAFLAGVLTTTQAEAARHFNIPAHVLMPPTWRSMFSTEDEALKCFGSTFTTMCIPLLDDTDLPHQLSRLIGTRVSFQAVRLLASDLYEQSNTVRRLLDLANRKHIKIIADGALNEHLIAELIEKGSPIDGFVIDASLGNLNPNRLKGVYKLVASNNQDGGWPSTASCTIGDQFYPCVKQVFRQESDDGSFDHDVIALANERLPGEQLLHQVMEYGSLCKRLPSLDECRDYSLMQRIRLPVELLDLTSEQRVYPVRYSDAIEKAVIDRQQSATR